MSTTYRVPSGPEYALTGRTRSSRAAKISPFLNPLRAVRPPVPVVVDGEPVQHVRGAVGDEHAAAQLRGQAVAAVDDGRGRALHDARGAVGPERLVAVAAIDAARRPHRPDLGIREGHQRLVEAARLHDVRVAHEVARGRVVHEEGRVVHVAPHAPAVVDGAAPLSAVEGRHHLEGAGLVPQVPVVLGRVDPVVEPPDEAVRVVLGVPLQAAVAVADQRLLVHTQVAVGVAHPPEVRRLAHEHAVGHGLDCARQDELVREDRPAIHLPVVVEVLQDSHAADPLAGVLHARAHREGGHLDDPHASVGVEIDEDRVLDQRLFRHQLDPVAGGERRSS
jgi:hypothetical protein